MIKELEYTLKKDDVVNFMYFHKFKIDKILTIFLVLCAIISFLCFITNKNPDIKQFIFVIICITSVIYYFISPYIKTLKHEDKVLNLKFESNKKTFFVGEEALVTVGNDCNWNYIKDIYNTKYNLLIYVSKETAFIIPKRIFKDEQELNETWNLIKECYEKNKIKKEQ